MTRRYGEKMHVLAAEQATNLGDVAIALGGSVLVAVVSVATIILSNKNARRLKLDDYRREELTTAADALEASRATIEHIATIVEMVDPFSSYRVGKENGATLETLRQEIVKTQAGRSSMEQLMLRLAVTNPHRLVRQAATITDESISGCVDRGVFEATRSNGSEETVARLKSQLDIAKKCLVTLRDSVHQTYHGEVPKVGSIRKSGLREPSRDSTKLKNPSDEGIIP